MGTAEWIILGGGVLSLGAWIWYYTAQGKRVSAEEKDRDLTYEMNPFTGSVKETKHD